MNKAAAKKGTVVAYDGSVTECSRQCNFSRGLLVGLGGRNKMSVVLIAPDMLANIAGTKFV
jgi:hypothetical protein